MMEVMDVAVDDADNIYIAGRFSDPAVLSGPSSPGVIMLPPDAEVATDYRWLYYFPDGVAHRGLPGRWMSMTSTRACM